ncbi:hypothetical protein BDC45DRAFT_574188 [Circinella umbellata]|nr:hypothetical protein BDC45DRAFT_574188 [Circinella umbellata]
MTDIDVQPILTIRPNRSPWVQMIEIIEDRLSESRVPLDPNTEHFAELLTEQVAVYGEITLTQLLKACVHPMGVPDATLVQFLGLVDITTEQQETQHHFNIGHTVYYYIRSLELTREEFIWILTQYQVSFQADTVFATNFIEELDQYPTQMHANVRCAGCTNESTPRYHGALGVEDPVSRNLITEQHIQFYTNSALPRLRHIIPMGGHTLVTPILIFAKDITRSDFIELRHFFAGSRSGDACRPRCRRRGDLPTALVIVSGEVMQILSTIIIVTLGFQATSVAFSNFQGSYSLEESEFKNMIGNPTIVDQNINFTPSISAPVPTSNYSILVPHIDPGFVSYGSPSLVILRYMHLTWWTPELMLQQLELERKQYPELRQLASFQNHHTISMWCDWFCNLTESRHILGLISERIGAKRTTPIPGVSLSKAFIINNYVQHTNPELWHYIRPKPRTDMRRLSLLGVYAR